MALEGAPAPRQERPLSGRALWAAAPAVHSLTAADLAAPSPSPKPKLAVNLTQGALGRAVAALTLFSVAFYYLSTGRSRNEPGRLLWGLVFGFLGLAVFLV